MKKASSSAWRVVALLWGVALLNYLDRQMISTMRPSMQGDIEALRSATSFGHLMAAFLWVYAVMSPFAGWIADRVNRRSLIALSLMVWSGVTLLMGFAVDYDQLFFLRGVMGMSEALYIPAALSLIADHHTGKTRSIATGIHMTGIYAGQALGGFGATLAASYDWRHSFQFFGVIGVLYSFVLLFFLTETRNTGSGGSEVRQTNGTIQLVKLLRNPSFWMLLLYFAIPSLPGWGVKNWLPTLLADNLHLEMALAGPLATVTIAFSSFAGVLAGGYFSDRWVRTNVRGRVYISALGLGLTVPALWFIGIGHSLPYVIASAFCFGIGFGMFDANNMPILCQLVPRGQRATAYGLMNMAGVYAGALITDYLGRSTDAGDLGRDFSLLSLVVLTAIVMQLLVIRPQTQDVE